MRAGVKEVAEAIYLLAKKNRAGFLDYFAAAAAVQAN